MKQSKRAADPNRRAKATADAIDAILDRCPWVGASGSVRLTLAGA